MKSLSKMLALVSLISIAVLSGCSEKAKTPAPATKSLKAPPPPPAKPEATEPVSAPPAPKAETAKPEAAKSEPAKSEPAKAEPAKADAAKADAAKADAAKADAARGDAAFWPRFHGPNNDNISTEKGLLKKWPEGGPKLLWTAKGLGAGWSSVSIAAGKLFTAGDVEKKTNVFALALADGKPVWNKEVSPGWTGPYPGAHSTPTVDGDRLYFESATGEVVCMNPADGAIVWSKNILKEFGAENIGWGLAESVLIDGDRLICCPGGPKASVVALNKKDGSVAWAAKSTGEKANYSTPMIGQSQGLRIVLTMDQRGLVAVAADDGELLFRYEHKTSYDINATTPVLAGNQIFITSGYGSGAEMLKLTVNGRKASVEPLWKNKKLDNHHGGLVVLDGHIYGSSMSGAWMCLPWTDGKPTWTDRGVGKGSLTYADGMLYTYSENGGKVGLVEATPGKFNLVSQFQVPEGGQGNSWAHPVVAGGRLYLRHGEFLYAYDVRQ